MRKLEILDTTLRDGAQAEGIVFSVEDKLALLQLFDNVEFDFIEGGNPSANPKDIEFFSRASKAELGHSKLVAFGATRHKNDLDCDNSALKTLVTSETQYISLVGKCWSFQIENVLGISLEENLKMISDSVSYLSAHQKQVFFDAEHFFEAYADNPEYSLKVLETAVLCGAKKLIICDTNGSSMPSTIYDITKTVVEHFPDTIIGIHCHNDCGLAVANSMRAVDAGASHIQGTFLGFGERCGNTNLSTIIPNLQLKKGYKIVSDSSLARFTTVARKVAEISNILLYKSLPYVGKSAFSHKAGMHADGVIKYSSTFEHISPDLVGNSRQYLLSEMAGRASLLQKLSSLFPDVSISMEEAGRLLVSLKEYEKRGYQFEGADASFYIFVLKCLNKFKPSFSLKEFSVTTKTGQIENSAIASIEINANGIDSKMTANGNGPVDALDSALRLALSQFYPQIKGIHLLDYKVRVINSEAATGAFVRTLITTTDGQNTWTTVGVSTDIINASWMALYDAVEYRLQRG